MTITRQQFLRIGAGAAAALAFRPSSSVAADDHTFYFALVADSHIVDEFYTGPESNPEDTESIFKTTERLTAARTVINALRPRIEQVFLVGDYFHDYPSADIDFYFQHRTRIDRAKELTDGFTMPVHVGFGNHDYAVSKVSREAYRDTVQRVVSGHWHRWFDFARSYGPPHLVMAATRYDPNAYLIVEVDLRSARHELLNIDGVDWNTHFAAPYTPRSG